jgi:hypothetical protein
MTNGSSEYFTGDIIGDYEITGIVGEGMKNVNLFESFENV